LDPVKEEQFEVSRYANEIKLFRKDVKLPKKVEDMRVVSISNSQNQNKNVKNG